MENQLQIFNNPEFGEIRTIFINGEIYFVGTDVANALGYKDTFAALKQHVDEEDKLVWQITSAGQKRNATVINESGLYSLILSSNLPKAKEFKHWVTFEVLPSIRKYGYYVAPNAEMHLREFARISVTTEEEKAKVESYLPMLSLQVKAMIKKFTTEYKEVTEENLPLVVDLPGEIWKWIKDYEGYYQASTFGRVRSFLKGKFKIIKPSTSHREYLSICLYKKGRRRKTYRLNRIIAETFIPNPENKPEVHHRDSNPKNNAVWNLEWVTSEENRQYAHEDGRYLKGADNPAAKLTENDVRYIRENYKSGDPKFGTMALAEKFGVSTTNILNIVKFKVWRNVQPLQKNLLFAEREQAKSAVEINLFN